MSAGGQWRLLRHYLSLSNLHTEVEKLLQRVKPASPQQWDNLIQRFEKAISIRLVRNSSELEVNKTTLNSSTVESAPVAAPIQRKEEKKSEETAPVESSKQEPSVLSDVQDITIESLLQGLWRKKDLHFGNISQQSWKNNKPIVSKSSIHSRTAYVVSALVAAQSPACRAKRAADFVHHIHQYPAARDYAIKEGAVRALLRARHATTGDDADCHELRAVVNEALALMGYTGPTLGPGPNILSLDGGGVRGLIAIEILRHLERLSGRPVHQLFDLVVGVSTGAILAAVLGARAGSLDAAAKLYRSLAHEMFAGTGVVRGASRLVWTHSYYDTAQWEKLLRDHLGELTLTQCSRLPGPKLALVSCVVTPGAKLSPFVFRSYSMGFRRRGARGSSGARVWEAVRASAAAPTYFEEFVLDGDVHQDGGILVNNPCGVALTEARLLFGPEALQRATIVSVGTGRPPAAPRPAATDGTSWKDKFTKILDSATDTEGVHELVNELLPAGSYYRLNPPLLAACSMDEVDPRRLDAMLTDTVAYIRRNQHKFEQAAARLTRPRGLLQRAGDALRHRALLLGLTAHH